MTKEEIGQIIKESRIAAGLTQNQVAKALDRPQQTIASWEKGKSQPDANTLFELFHVLGRSVDEAFGFKAKGENNAPPLSGEALRVARDFMNLDHFGRDFVLTVLDKQLERQRKETQEREELWAERFYPAAMEELEALKLPDGSFEVAVFDKTAARGLLTSEIPSHATMQFPPNTVPPDTILGIQLPDDAMGPSLPQDSIAFIGSCPFLVDGLICVFIGDGKIYCRQFKSVNGSPLAMSLRPLNPAYDEIPYGGRPVYHPLGYVTGGYDLEGGHAIEISQPSQ